MQTKPKIDPTQALRISQHERVRRGIFEVKEYEIDIMQHRSIIDKKKKKADLKKKSWRKY